MGKREDNRVNDVEQRRCQQYIDEFHFQSNPYVFNKISTGKSGADIYIVQILDMSVNTALIKVSSQEEVSKESEFHDAALNLALASEIDNFIPKIIEVKEYNGQQAIMYEFAGSYDSFTLNEAITNQLAVNYEKIVMKALDFAWKWGYRRESSVKRISAYDAIIRTLGEDKWAGEHLLEPIKELGVDTNHKLLGIDGGYVFPNPLIYLYNKNLWKDISMLIGFKSVHGDFHGNNIIIKNKENVDMAVIDFMEYRDEVNLFFDSRYLELHLLLDGYSYEEKENQANWLKICEYLTRDFSHKVSQNMEPPDGIYPFHQILPCFGEKYISTYKDQILLKEYMPSYHLAGFCVGLICARRKGMEKAKRFAALVYALFNFKELLKSLKIDFPNESLLPLKWSVDLEGKEMRKIIDEEKYHFYAQPIVNLRTGKVDFVEVFTRFDTKTPDYWFNIARKYDLLGELTIRTCQSMVDASHNLEELNLSGFFFNVEADLPEEVIRKCIGLLKQCHAPVMIEITEHKKKDTLLWKKISEEEQVQIAIDDFGDAATTELDEIPTLEPAFVKITVDQLTRYYNDISHLNREYIRRLIVEKVEEPSDIFTLNIQGIKYAQGWYFDNDKPIESLPVDEWSRGYLDRLNKK